MQNFSDIQTFLAEDIEQLDRVIFGHLNSNIALINQISQYIIRSGGKRLRPLLLLLTAKALDYQDSDRYELAAVVEYIHTATLLHDDVVDQSKMRRGQGTAHKKWGNAASVLTGDFLYSRAFEVMVGVHSMAVMAVLAKATNIIAEGEVLQLLHCQNPELTIKEYFQVIERKTACLFQTSAQLGAVIAKTDESKTKALANYGLHLGNAFQIVDDILDYQASTKTTGKEPGNDLAEGKTTLPIIYALKSANKADKALLTKSVCEADTSQIQAIIAILDKTMAFKKSYQQAKHCVLQAKKCLSILQDSPAKEALNLLADFALDRQS